MAPGPERSERPAGQCESEIRPVRRRGRRLRRGGLIALAACLGAAGSGCAPERDSAAAAADAIRGGTLVVALRSVPDSANPYVARTQASLELANRTLPRLFVEVLPEDLEGTVALRAQLVRDWKFSDDHLRLEMSLRDDARWDDGRPVTCEDLAFTLEAQRDPALAWAGASYKDAIAGLDCPAPDRAVWRFDRPGPYQLMDVNDIHVLPRSIADVPRGQWRAVDWAERMPAAGPFRITSWNPSEQIVLERNESWWGAPERPLLDRIVLRHVPDTTALLAQLLAGEVHFAAGLEPSTARRAGQDAGVVVHRRAGWNYVYLGWNLIDPEAYRAYRERREASCRRSGDEACIDTVTALVDLARRHPHPLFGDPRVRRAMTQAIDRSQLIDTLLLGAASIPPSPILAPLPEHDGTLTPLPHDPEAAKALLREAGFADSDGDGVLDRGGRPFRFTVQVHAGNKLRNDAAVMIRQQLADVGVDMRIEPVEPAAFYPRLFGRQMDAWIGRWRVSTRVDMTELFGEASCATGSPNLGCFVDDRANELARRARSTIDDEARWDLWHAWEARFQQLQPYTMLFRADLFFAARKELHGSESCLANDALEGVESWWLEASAGRAPH